MTTVKTELGVYKRQAYHTSYDPGGTISATDVQNAIEEAASEAAPVDASYYVTASNSLLSAEVVVPAFIQTLLDDTSQGAARTTLGVGTADNPNFAGLFITEKAAAEADVAGQGQLWVQAATPNLLMFTDDAGSDFSVANYEDLASTSNALGASLIGIEDSGALITATTVEGALAENRTAIDAIEADYLTSTDIGSTVQAYDADLDTWATLTPSANAQSLVTAADYAAMRTLLDLEAGTDFYSISAADAAFQPLDSDLTAIAALSSADSNFIVGSPGGWVAESGATVRTSLGLAIGSDVQAYDANTAKLDVNQNWSANQNFQDNTLQRPKMFDYSVEVNVLGDLGGGTDDIDLSSGNVVSATVSTSTETFTFSNPPASGTEGKLTLYLTNGGSQTVNWPASVDWPGGTAPSLTASGVDILVFTTIDGGTTWYGNLVGSDYS